MGLPTILVPVADNQRPLAKALAEAGAAFNAGGMGSRELAKSLEILCTDSIRRATFSTRGRRLVDGLGAPRVVAALRGSFLELRPAQTTDCRWYFELANELGVRASAIDQAPIPWEGHQRWFSERLADSLLLVASDQEGNRLGQIRFGEEDGHVEIDYSVIPALRGKGLGVLLLERGLAACSKRWPHRRIEAVVREENVASLRTFQKAGFLPLDREIRNRVRLVRLGKGGWL